MLSHTPSSISKLLYTHYTSNVTLMVKDTEVKHRQLGARKADYSVIDSEKSPAITNLLYNADRHAEGTAHSRRRDPLQSWAAHGNEKGTQAGAPGL